MTLDRRGVPAISQGRSPAFERFSTQPPGTLGSLEIEAHDALHDRSQDR